MKTQVGLEFKLVSDRKGNEKDFCKYIGSKRKTNTITNLPLNRMGDLMMKDKDRLTELLGSYWQVLFFSLPNLCGRVCGERTVICSRVGRN